MTKIQYGLKTKTKLSATQVETVVREALAAEGFGVLTEIDVADTLRTKLGFDRRPYVILGACKPQLAAAALEAEPDVGLLLPCNIAVYETDTETVVAVLDPATMVDLTANPLLKPIAAEAKTLLQRVLAAVDAA